MLGKGKSRPSRSRSKKRKGRTNSNSNPGKKTAIRVAKAAAASSIGKSSVTAATGRAAAMKAAVSKVQSLGIKVRNPGQLSEHEARAAVDITLNRMARNMGVSLANPGQPNRAEALQIGMAAAQAKTGYQPGGLTRKEARIAAQQAANQSAESPEIVQRNVMRLVAMETAEKGRIHTTRLAARKAAEAAAAQAKADAAEQKNKQLLKQVANQAANQAKERAQRQAFAGIAREAAAQAANRNQDTGTQTP